MTRNPVVGPEHIWPTEFPTGRQPSQPEMQTLKPWEPRPERMLTKVDLEAVEMRLMAFTFPKQCGKTEAMKAMADGNIQAFYAAMGVPFEHLGKDRTE